jgi:hypothetical protein
MILTSHLFKVFFTGPEAAAPKAPLPLALFSALLGVFLGLGNTPADANGIHVRFLANPAEDSIVKYRILRAEAPGQASQSIGEVAAPLLADTLGFPDLTAAKGKPYSYSIKAINAGGGESDPSSATVVAYPALALPDTLRPDKATGLTRFVIPAESDPLRGTEPLLLTLQDSTRFTLAFDSATHTITFRARSGRIDSAWARVSAQYYGKFSDQDSLLLVAGIQPTVSLGSPISKESAGARENGIRSGLPQSMRLWQGRDAAGRLLPASPRL